MTYRCLEEATEIFAPHQMDLTSIVHDALSEAYEKYGADFHELEAWTKASIIRDKIVARLKLYCEERPSLQPVRNGNASYFGFYSKFLVKVKRFGAGFRVNLPSTTA